MYKLVMKYYWFKHIASIITNDITFWARSYPIKWLFILRHCND